MTTFIYFAKSVWSNEQDIYSDQDDGAEDDSINQPPSRNNEKEFDQRLLIQKTKPEPCDKELYIYTLTRYTDKNISGSSYNKSMSNDCSRYFKHATRYSILNRWF